MPEYLKLVKQFNDTGVVLMQYELKIQTAWNTRNPTIRYSIWVTHPQRMRPRPRQIYWNKIVCANFYNCLYLNLKDQYQCIMLRPVGGWPGKLWKWKLSRNGCNSHNLLKKKDCSTYSRHSSCILCAWMCHVQFLSCLL